MTAMVGLSVRQRTTTAHCAVAFHLAVARSIKLLAQAL